MKYSDVFEKLALQYHTRSDDRQAVMSAPGRFFVYNPTLLENLLGVGEHLHEAQQVTKGKSKGQYELRILADSPFWDRQYSDLILLDDAEGQEFLDYHSAAREYADTRKTGSRAYLALEEAFDDLKSTYLERIWSRFK